MMQGGTEFVLTVQYIPYSTVLYGTSTVQYIPYSTVLYIPYSTVLYGTSTVQYIQYSTVLYVVSGPGICIQKPDIYCYICSGLAWFLC